MAWTWSLQAALGSKLPIEVWDNIAAFSDPREEHLRMPTVPTSYPKIVGFLTPDGAYPTNLFILVNMCSRLSLNLMLAGMEIHRFKHVLFVVCGGYEHYLRLDEWRLYGK